MEEEGRAGVRGWLGEGKGVGGERMEERGREEMLVGEGEDLID